MKNAVEQNKVYRKSGLVFTKRKREKPTNMFDRERTNQIDITLNAGRASTSESFD